MEDFENRNGDGGFVYQLGDVRRESGESWSICGLIIENFKNNLSDWVREIEQKIAGGFLCQKWDMSHRKDVILVAPPLLLLQLEKKPDFILKQQ